VGLQEAVDLVPFSTFWFVTTALEMFLLAWWLSSPVARVWLHFIGGLLSRRPYWAPPWKHRWADDLSRPPLPFSHQTRRSLIVWLIGAAVVGMAAGYALLYGGGYAGRGAPLLFVLTQPPFWLTTALLLDAATPESNARPWNRLRGWRMGKVEPPRFRLADDRPNAIRFLTKSPTTPHGGGDLRLWITVTNPNPFGIELERLETRLFLEGRRANYRKFPLSLRIDAGQAAVMPIDLSFSSRDLMVTPGALGATVGYRVQGVLWIDAGKFGRPMFGPMGIVFGELPVISSS
jgi:hypothetical protein